GFSHHGERLFGLVAQLDRAEAEDVPPVCLQEVVAFVVRRYGFRPRVPEVAVALDVDVPLLAEEGEVEEIIPANALSGGIGHLDEELALGQELGAAEAAIEWILDGTADEEVVEFFREGDPLPVGGDEEDPPAARGGDRFRQALQRPQ